MRLKIEDGLVLIVFLIFLAPPKENILQCDLQLLEKEKEQRKRPLKAEEIVPSVEKEIESFN